MPQTFFKHQMQPGVIARRQKRAEAAEALPPKDRGRVEERICPQCEQSFLTPTRLGHSNRHCSRRCSFDAKRARRKPCPVCRQPIVPTYLGQRTCGASECKAEYVRTKTRTQAACRWCATMFWPTRQPTGKFEVFCSRQCYEANRAANDWRIVNCEACGCPRRRRRSSTKRSVTFFCTRECQAGYFSGDKHPLWRGDADPNRGRGWKRIAARRRQLDGYKCRRCGVTEAENGQRLAVDHIVPWRLFEDKDKANAMGNLASLCKPCHGYKTAYVEPRYLRGDVIAFHQYLKAVTIASATR